VIIHINGCPGVGKLTVGRLLADALGARLVDNHSIYNLAFALAEPKSEAYFAILREVRATALKWMLALPGGTPIVLTNAHFTDSTWGNENWDEMIRLARARDARLLVVILECDIAENDRRIASPDRALRRKLTDPTKFFAAREGRKLIDRGGDETLRIDTTLLTAEQTGEQVLQWVRALGASSSYPEASRSLLERP
jgi:predicted kinase